MSIVPSDSVSRRGESNSEFGNSDLCKTFLVPPVYPSTDLVPIIGPARFADRLLVYDKQMASYYAACQSMCRAYASPVGSASSVSVGSVQSGLCAGEVSSPAGSSSLGSRASGLGKMNKMAVRRFSRDMRSKGVARSLTGGGFCYVRALRPEARESAALALGAYPALGDLLSRPREEFLPLSATSSLTFSVASNGVAHVDYVGQRDGYSYNQSLSQLASSAEFNYASYGHMLRSEAPVYDSRRDSPLFTLTTCVGGDGFEGFASESFGNAGFAGCEGWWRSSASLGDPYTTVESFVQLSGSRKVLRSYVSGAKRYVPSGIVSAWGDGLRVPFSVSSLGYVPDESVGLTDSFRLDFSRYRRVAPDAELLRLVGLEISTFQGVFSSGGASSITSVCPVPFQTNAVAMCLGEGSSFVEQLDSLESRGLTVISRAVVFVDGVLVSLAFLNLESGLSDRSSVSRAVSFLHGSSSVRVLGRDSFAQLRARSVSLEFS